MTKKKIIDAQTPGLVVRPSVRLPDDQGEWLKEEEPEIIEGEPEEEEEEAAAEKHEETASGDLYQSFVRQATKIPRLSEEEERALGLKVRSFGDDAAAKKLVVHNMRLAIKMAHQYRRSWTNLMDLVQEASAGLAIASKRWDPDMGTRFGTYAAYWIRAQLTKFLMTNSRLIHTGNTRAGRKVYFSLPQIRRKLLARGEEPTVERIAQEVNEDPKEVALIMSRLQAREASLSAPLDDEGSITLLDSVASFGESPEEEVSRSQLQEMIQTIIDSFEKSLENERDLAIWKEHLIAKEPKSLVELGERYGVSKQRMGQLATRIKRAFRRHIIDNLGSDTQLSWLFNSD
jgi:RNA polymerase sigma-32 factor